MSGGRGPKRKGSAFEREVVRTLVDFGVIAFKVPLSGAVKFPGFDHDVRVSVRGVDRRVEAKRRKRSFGTLTKMLGDNYALVVRDDNSPTLVVLRLEDFADLARDTTNSSARWFPTNPGICNDAKSGV